MAREVNHPIIASGTVAANLLRFSNATGAYFVDTTDATLAAALAAAVKHNDIVEVLDGSKRAIRFVAKEQGAGETVAATELLTNGDMSSDEPPGSAWSRGVGVTVSGGKANFNGAVDISNLTQSINPGIGKLCKLSGDVVRTSGSMNLVTLSKPSASISSSGAYTNYGTALYSFGSNVGIFNQYNSFNGTVDNLSLKQVLTPSTSGVFAAKYPGGADGFSLVAASFDYNSATGYTWRTVSSVPNGRTVYDQATTTGQIRLSTVDGTAFVDSDVIDLSTYAGGSYLLAFYDSSNRVAWAYGKTAGAGETLGDELLPQNLTSGWTESNCTINDADTFTTPSGSGGPITTATVLPANILVVGSLNATPSAGIVELALNGSTLSFGISPVSSAYKTIATSSAVGARIRNTDTSTTNITSMTMKQVLTPSALGLTITSTPDGATYNWAQITTGFDANTVTSVKVWRAL